MPVFPVNVDHTLLYLVAGVIHRNHFLWVIAFQLNLLVLTLLALLFLTSHLAVLHRCLLSAVQAIAVFLLVVIVLRAIDILLKEPVLFQHVPGIGGRSHEKAASNEASPWTSSGPELRGRPGPRRDDLPQPHPAQSWDHLQRPFGIHRDISVYCPNRRR